MELFASIGERLREERERLDKSQTELAEIVAKAGVRGATRQSQSLYEKGERFPDAAYLSLVASKGLDVLYVLTGERRTPELKKPSDASDSYGSGRAGLEVRDVSSQLIQYGVGSGKTSTAMAAVTTWFARNKAPLVLPVLFADSHTTREFQVIPQYRDASAGKGLGAVSGNDINEAGVVAFDKSWMIDTFGRADGLATVRVHGDSMEPTLADGETIVIDTHVSKVDTSGVYVIKVGDNVLVKRVQHKLDGTLVIKSDNPQYEPELVRPGSMRVHVAGRMVWPKMR